MEKLHSMSNELEGEGLNIREEIENYIIHWKWMILSIIVFLSIAFLYLRYTIPIYSATTTIMVRDDKKGSVQSELSVFTDLRSMAGTKGTVENETEVFKSRTLIEKTIKNLGLNITYFTEGRLKTFELYDDCPIKCNFTEVNDDFYKSYKTYIFNLLGNNKFQLLNDSNALIGVYHFGDTITVDGNKLVVVKNILVTNFSQKEYKVTVTVNKLLDVVQSFKGRLNITPLGKNTSLLELAITDPIKERAENFLNDLVTIYNSETIEDKNYISKKTEDFIENRIRLISEELGDVEKGEEGFKRSNNITDLTIESSMFLSNSSELEKQIIDNGTEQIKMTTYCQEML
jgi:tyrosine-protein kinase Etk/Wzc